VLLGSPIKEKAMPRVDEVRLEVQKLWRAIPFRPFTLLLEGGQQVYIEHPENIAFKPNLPGGGRVSGTFSAITDDGLFIGNFGAVTGVHQDDPDNLAS
jgi:hypothetical protein